MVIRILILSLFISSCGNNVKFSNSNLESNSKLTTAEAQSFLKSGTLSKNTTNTVIYNGQTYKVSIYSSNNASQFIASIPMGTQVPIKFTGGTSGTEIVLETVQRQ